MSKGMISLHLRGISIPGGYKHHTVLTEVLRASGKHLEKVWFNSLAERRDYVVNLLIPFSGRIGPHDKHTITVWLKSSGFTELEVRLIYARSGIERPGIRAMLAMFDRVPKDSLRPTLPDTPDAYTLYKLWRDLDVSYEELSARHGIPIQRLKQIISAVFTEKCLSAKNGCVYSSLIGKPVPKCALDGCKEFVMIGENNRPNKYCCPEHSREDAKRHPEKFCHPQYTQKLDSVYRKILSGQIQTQAQLSELCFPQKPPATRSRDACRIIKSLLGRGWIIRKPEGRTFRLIPIREESKEGA